MSLPQRSVKLARRRRVEHPKTQAIPGIHIDILLKPYETEQSTPGVMGVATAIAAPGVILLVVVLILPPIVHEQIVVLRILQRHLVKMVAVKALIDHVVGRPPDITPPVKLVLKSRIISGNGGNYIPTPELLGVEHMFRHHSSGLFRRRNACKKRIKVGG